MKKKKKVKKSKETSESATWPTHSFILLMERKAKRTWNKQMNYNDEDQTKSRKKKPQ